MPDSSGVQPLQFACAGGLVLNKSAFEMLPGMAQELVNFEPDINGGYRRINGTAKWNDNVVPFTTSDTEKLLMVASFGATDVIAARGESVYVSTNATTALNGGINNSVTTITVDDTTGFSTAGTLLIGTEQITYTGTTATTFTGCTRGANSTSAASHLDDADVVETWTSIESGRTSADKYTFKRYNFDGTDKIIYADGASKPSFYNGSTVTQVTCSACPTDPSIVEVFKNHIFLAGDSTTPEEIYFSAPFSESNYQPANGGGSIRIDDTVVQLRVFREQLYIFGKDKIYRLVGNTVADFQLQPVTRDIGCVAKHSVQELAGDLIFLAPDGLRTIAGTEKIGDVELGTISRAIQVRFDNLTSYELIESVIVPNKTQYRLFFSNEDDTQPNTKGVLASLTENGFAFADIRGIKPSCSDTDVTKNPDVVLHGGFDGYVYQQEVGNDFDGVAINGKYRSPDLTMGDAGIRKVMQRVILNYAPEAAISADMFLRYDYEAPSTPRPAAYPLDSSQVLAIYGVSTYGVSTYGGQRQPLVRQPVEGSGFAIAIRVNDDGVSAPYSLKGFQLEFGVGARR